MARTSLTGECWGVGVESPSSCGVSEEEEEEEEEEAGRAERRCQPACRRWKAEEGSAHRLRALRTRCGRGGEV